MKARGGGGGGGGFRGDISVSGEVERHQPRLAGVRRDDVKTSNGENRRRKSSNYNQPSPHIVLFPFHDRSVPDTVPCTHLPCLSISINCSSFMTLLSALCYGYL